MAEGREPTAPPTSPRARALSACSTPLLAPLPCIADDARCHGSSAAQTQSCHCAFATTRGYMFSISAASNYIELGERIEAPFATYRRGSCFGSDPPRQVLPCFAVCGCCNLWVVHGYSLVPEPVRKECQEMACRRGTGFVLIVVVARSACMSEGGPARVCARARLFVPACAGAGGWRGGGWGFRCR